MLTLSDEIWQARLQVLWIILAAVYVAVGKVYPRRSLSSLLILLAGFLLVALLAHVLVKKDARKLRGVLLVAFGSSIFLVSNSYSPFSDMLAAVFAVIFSIMTGSLLVLRLDGKVSQRLRYHYFVSMVLTLVGGTLGFVVTLAVKYLLDLTVGRNGYYIIGAQGLASVACFATGLIAGPAALPSTLPYNSGWRRIEPILFSLALLPAVVLVSIYRKPLTVFFGTILRSSIFVAVQGIVAVAVSIFLIRELVGLHGRRRRTIVLGLFVLAILVSAFATASLIGFLRVGSIKPGFIALAFGVEAPTYFAIYGGVILGVVLARRMAENTQGRRRDGRRAAQKAAIA